MIGMEVDKTPEALAAEASEEGDNMARKSMSTETTGSSSSTELLLDDDTQSGSKEGPTDDVGEETTLADEKSWEKREEEGVNTVRKSDSTMATVPLDDERIGDQSPAVEDKRADEGPSLDADRVGDATISTEKSEDDTGKKPSTPKKVVLLDCPTKIDETGSDDGSEVESGEHRPKARASSIYMNEADLEALQRELELETEEKPQEQRQREQASRDALKGTLEQQMQRLHQAHRSNTLLSKTPNEGEQTKQLTMNSYPSPTGEGLCVSVKFSGKDIQSFYSAMESFSAFKDITTDEYFTEAPDNWHVVITDVKGSTKAIEAGRYRDVNTVGAASISVVMKLLDEDFPYVFGGDGATLLIPPTEIGRVLEALLRLQRLSEEQFDLGLRVGHIPVRDVKAAGGRIEVAKYELTAGRCVAIFRGGGLTVAEKCIKGQEDKYCLRYKTMEDVELTGLSCRWNAIPNKRGHVMSLLVCARDNVEPREVYNHVIQELEKIYDGQLDDANPVNLENMTYKTVPQIYDDEKRFHTNTWTSGFFDRVAEIFLAVATFLHGLDPMFFDHKYYFQSMRGHADHRKFDDMLRMVIDCSTEQAAAIEKLMEGLYKEQKAYYGIFLSDTALMTCYLEDLADGQHIHFIDGGDGGYAMAAKIMKAQMKRDSPGEE